MRAVWCLLVVFCLLSPLGTAGITIAPADAETEVTAPRSAVELPAGPKRVLELAAVVPATSASPAIVQELAVTVPVASASFRPRLVDPVLRSRAPPV